MLSNHVNDRVHIQAFGDKLMLIIFTGFNPNMVFTFKLELTYLNIQNFKQLSLCLSHGYR